MPSCVCEREKNARDQCTWNSKGGSGSKRDREAGSSGSSRVSNYLKYSLSTSKYGMPLLTLQPPSLRAQRGSVDLWAEGALEAESVASPEVPQSVSSVNSTVLTAVTEAHSTECAMFPRDAICNQGHLS